MTCASILEGSIEEGTVLTDLMGGEDSLLKAMDASEILMLIPSEPSASI